jgi:transposase
VRFQSVVRAIIAGERVLPKLLEVVMPRIRRPYPSDLSDQEWALLEPLLASSERRGRPPKWAARHVADAVFYLLRSGCAWRMLPREYPLWQTVYYHFPAGGAWTAGSVERTTRSGPRSGLGRTRPGP